MTSKSPLMALITLAAVFLSGCAMVEPDDFAALQRQVYNNQREIKKLSEQLAQARKPQADLRAEQDSLRQEINQIRGQIEETRHRLDKQPDSAALLSQAEKKAQAASESSAAKYEAAKADLDKRLTRLEDYLGVKGGKIPPKAKAAPAAAAQPQTDQEMYNLGKRLYQQKSYNAARDQFQGLLNKHPKSSLLAASLFLIGETYYAQKKYEEAILNYNQVIKRYPKSTLVPSAMLKQGLGFLALGDKHAARIVLTKLTNEHPNSSQAKSAKRQLAKIK